jgi:hypothetical protein
MCTPRQSQFCGPLTSYIPPPLLVLVLCAEFTKELFVDYFFATRAELLKRSDLKQVVAALPPGLSGAQVAAEEAAAIAHLTLLLKQFYTGLVRPNVLVPQARLLDRAAEIIEV